MSESWTFSICVPEQETYSKPERPQGTSKAQGNAPTKAVGVRTLQEKNGFSSDSSKTEHFIYTP